MEKTRIPKKGLDFVKNEFSCLNKFIVFFVVVFRDFFKLENSKNGISQVQCVFGFLQFIDVLCETFSKFVLPHKVSNEKKGRIIVKSDTLLIRPRIKV